MTAPIRRVFVCSGMLPLLIASLEVGRAADTIAHQITLPAGQSWCDDGMIIGLFNQINTFRSQHGVPPLKMDALGMKDAEIRATQFIANMAANPPGSPGFNPHLGYDTTAAALGYRLISENLAYLKIDPAAVVYGVWQDTLHIAAMLANDADIAGVSCVYSDSTPYWTYEPGQSSASPAPVPTPVPVPTPTPTPPATPGPATPPDGEEWAFLTLINNYRAQNGLGNLQVSAALENSAHWMSNDMATKNYASHTDSLGRDTASRLAAFGYPYSPWGENLAGGFADAQSTFNQWLNACDPDQTGNCTYAHRKNMLGAGFNVIGIGRAYGPSSVYAWYWTTDFGGVVDQVISSTPTPTPTPSPTPAPTISFFSANPASILVGQNATLSWSATGATAVSIDHGVGTIPSASSVLVSPSQTTTYTLTASNSGGSVTAQVTIGVAVPVPPSDQLPPSPPGVTSAAASSATQVDILWTPSADNVGVAGYRIIRNGSVIASVSPALLRFTDTGASPSTTYSYAVQAYDAAGNTATSNVVMVTTPAGSSSGACPPPATGAFTACFYNGLDLAGPPVLVRTDTQINFDWGSIPPAPQVRPDDYSVRWQGNFVFDGGEYTFAAMTSDGMRIYLDGNIVLDRWRDQPAYMYNVRQTVSSGTHLITVEYYDHRSWATAHLSWSRNQ